MDLEQLLNPKSIAIIGATDEKGKVGNAICSNILNLGFEGKVFLVNPKHDKLFGKDCFPSVEAITEPIDLAIVVIPAKFVAQVIQNGGDLVKNYVIISAGFSEIGEEGKKREEEIMEIASTKNLNILGPNCLGFIIPKIKLNASFAGGLPQKGNISFISQSGALISTILDISKNKSFGFSNIISIGNKMQISESDLFEYLELDLDTKVIGMYLEGIADVEKFKMMAWKLSKIKPVVILKAGKTERSKKAITSHTGALAGSEEIVRAIFKKTGIIQAENLSEFINMLKIISFSDAPFNEKSAVITNAGGPGVLTTDAFFAKDLELSHLSDKSKEELRKFLPIESSVENPVDLLGDAQEDRYEKTLEILDKEEIGSIIAVLTPQENTPTMKIAQKIIEFKEKSKKPVIAAFLGGDKIKTALALLRKSGIPCFSFPEEAVDSMNKYYQWGNYRKKDFEIPEKDEKETKQRKEKAWKVIEKVRFSIRTMFSFSESKEIMDTYGINAVNFQEIDFKKELEIDFPMVLKVDSDKVFHKTDKQGVVLKIKNEEELKIAYDQMTDKFPNEKIIIQPMVEIRTELLIGIKRDESVGPVIVVGLGGIYTEIFKMVDFIIPPTTKREIKETLLKSPVGFLFKGNRGEKEYDLEEISDIIFKVSQLADEVPEIKELDINPLLIYNDGRKALAVDVKIII